VTLDEDLFMAEHSRKFSPQFKAEAVQVVGLPVAAGLGLNFQEVLVRASMVRTAAMDSRIAVSPMHLGLAMDGCAPAFRAARSHRSRARDPVTNRFGPRLRPVSSAKG
jgi:hypothetical protein